MRIFEKEIFENVCRITIFGLFKISFHLKSKLKKVVIFGNCVCGSVADMMHCNSEIKQKYEIILLKPCFICTKKDVPKMHKHIKKCDVLITQQISGTNYLKLKLDTKTLQKKLKRNAKLIIIPTPYFSGYNPEQTYLYKENREKILYCDGLEHPYHNKLILHGYINNIQPEKLLEKINSLTPFLDFEGSQLFEEHAVPAILPPNRDNNYIFLFNNLNGKPFVKIIDSLTENLRKIKEGFTPSQKIANDIEQEFPQYRKL